MTSIVVQSGSRNASVRFLLIHRESGAGVVGLTEQSSGLSVAYVRDDRSEAISITVNSWIEDGTAPGAFREIDGEAMPGLYELRLPDDVCAVGANRCTVAVNAEDAIPEIIHLDLVGYDPYDSYRLGLECLTRDARHEVIAGAFREVVPEIVDEFKGKSAVDANRSRESNVAR